MQREMCSSVQIIKCVIHNGYKNKKVNALSQILHSGRNGLLNGHANQSLREMSVLPILRTAKSIKKR